MLGKPEPHQLIPAPAVAKPAVGCYPQAPIYTLNVELDHSYRRGWAYAAAYHPDNDFALEHDRMLNIRIPPKVLPTAFNKRTRTFHSEDIPGMVRFPMGVPLVHHINGDPKKPVTAVCGHTLDSLAQYPEGADVAALVPRLMELTWGVAATETDRGVSGIFDLDGMQRNLRSKHVNLSKLGDGNGSFNIASTRGEGEGHGMFMPAVQTNVPQAAKIIKEVLEILHKLYRLIMPLCISRFEWDMIEFNALENNVIAFGGLDPGPTSVQLNASSTANIIDLGVELLEEDEPHPLIDVDTDADEATDLLPIYHWLLQACLDSTLGDQGRPHGDPQDDTVSCTLFDLLFRAAPGSDLGTFLCMRGGIYLRELNAYIVFTAFKGHDIHCGQPPTFVKQIQDAWISLTTAQKLFQRFGPQVRCGYVLYWSQAATTHSTQIQYSRSLHFLYSPAPDKKDENRRYFITDRETILGDSDSRANRLAREGIYALKNYLQQCQLKLGFDINTLLENTTYKDECGQVQALKRAPLDIEDEHVYEMMCLYRRYYAWLQDLVGSQYSLGISKSKFKERQKEIPVYQWITNLGPSLATQLVTILPDFTSLVTHVVEFVRTHQVQSHTNKPKTGRGGQRKPGRPKRRLPGKSSEQAQASTQDEPANMPADLINGGETASPKKKTQIPADLFGLLPASSSMITLEPLDPKVVVNNEEALYKISAKYLCKIWEEHLVLKPMLKVDQYLNPNQPQPRTRETMEGVRDRCIIRGAILLSLADVFGDGLTKDRRLARAVEKDERGALQVLNSHLISTLVESPEAEEYSAQLGELVHRALLSLKLGYALTDEEYENPHELLTANESFLKLAASKRKNNKREPKTVPDISSTLESLLPRNPSFGIPAVIVREALSSRRKKKPTPETTIFRRMLEAKHPMTGHPTKHDPDQMDPIRADLKGLRWLHQFRAIETRNVTLADASAIKFDNPAVYGQPNSWYSAHPTVRAAHKKYVTLTLEEKFAPYFAPEIQRSWLAFLGPLADQDPALSSSSKKSWGDVARWIVQSGLNGFGSGLAPLQFANNMVLAGVAIGPSPAAMAQWIFANKSYGAFAGLRVLGFKLSKKASPAAVRAAFMCFYLWLDRHLSHRDKTRLRFDTIFVEQLLCKIGRWKGRILDKLDIEIEVEIDPDVDLDVDSDMEMEIDGEL
ncbi:hypothetical protein B0H10DRAFT_2238839 [Mycena sp. CBHHK59/15]|nr:hypothetical protein B0H10DRAFT_2238839 [Mycena sp. CBHHK59/15]